MRRQDIQLMARARQGDAASRHELARRYLQGVEGFGRHVSTGLDYLNHPAIAGTPRAATLIAESLSLNEAIKLGQLGALRDAALGGSALAQFKLGLWQALIGKDPADASRWLSAAARAGHGLAQEFDVATRLPSPQGRLAVFEACFRLSKKGLALDAAELGILAIDLAIENSDLAVLAELLACVVRTLPAATAGLSETVLKVLVLARAAPDWKPLADATAIEDCLGERATQGDASAALMLGRALCGFDQGSLPASALCSAPNLRKGAALLLRAGDAGQSAAWALLHRIHADHHCSVANPSMARYFLEKAASAGVVEAQRRLGALILRSAASLHDSEEAIRWLHAAAAAGDRHAAPLLESLVLPVAGSAEIAGDVIAAIRQEDAWLACRLQTARDFGLTRLEALCVDIVKGHRAWGLVVGPNPFIAQAKLGAPRAVPALDPAALERLDQSVAYLMRSQQDSTVVEGDYTRRSRRLRLALKRYGADEDLFFAEARSTTLHALRTGTKWAVRARQPLELALAA